MKKFTSILIIILLIIIAKEILIQRESIINSVNFSLSIWKENVFPSLFPFFVLSDIMIAYGLVEFTSIILGPLTNKLFKINNNGAFIFIMSLIVGNPSAAKYIKELLELKKINKEEATKILCISSFASPLFILGTVSILFLNNKKVGLLILICHYISGIIIGILIRNYYPVKQKQKTNIKKAINTLYQKRIENKKSFGETLTKSIINSLNTLILILGIMTIFLTITTIIDNNINLNNIYQSTLNGYIEMTQGLKYISLEPIPLKIKSTLSVMILSFAGLSVHMQIISILNNTGIKYIPFLCCRIMHSLLSGILLYNLFDLWFS